MPLTLEQHAKKLKNPAVCEQLPVRDYLDNVVVRTNGSFVAGYELKGLTTYFASDEGRNRGKLMLEALLRSIPEQSMRVQLRYEVVEDLGDLLDRYVAGQQSTNDAVRSLDATRVERWRIAPTPVDYWVMTTYPRERVYRAWWLQQRKGMPLLDVYRELATRFPTGLADIDPLPEELSGEVAKGANKL